MIVDGQIHGGLTEGFAVSSMQWITCDDGCIDFRYRTGGANMSPPSSQLALGEPLRDIPTRRK